MPLSDVMRSALMLIPHIFHLFLSRYSQTESVSVSELISTIGIFETILVLKFAVAVVILFQSVVRAGVISTSGKSGFQFYACLLNVIKRVILLFITLKSLTLYALTKSFFLLFFVLLRCA